jgi:hypothetical protein
MLEVRNDEDPRRAWEWSFAVVLLVVVLGLIAAVAWSAYQVLAPLD